jgi:UDP-2-acetamido-3-amino-2,3-dideoxy-glucuronate N-acetyltransferase
MNNYFSHDTAIIDIGAQIGAGTKIWHFSHVMGGAQIGERCVLGQNVYVGARAVVGNGVKIQNNVSLYDAVILDDDVFCGPSCVFTNVVNPRAFVERKTEYHETRVKRGASIGANATIVCGVTLGEYCLIGAGAVVTKDVPAYAVMTGVPARRTGWVSRVGVVLGPDLRCPETGEQYMERDGQLFLA